MGSAAEVVAPSERRLESGTEPVRSTVRIPSAMRAKPRAREK